MSHTPYDSDQRLGLNNSLSPMSKILEFRDKREYNAQQFSANTEGGVFIASGTLCGHLDFVIPEYGTLCLSPHEARELAAMLMNCAIDVETNSRPFSDPRLEKEGKR